MDRILTPLSFPFHSGSVSPSKLHSACLLLLRSLFFSSILPFSVYFLLSSFHGSLHFVEPFSNFCYGLCLLYS
uniref:Uncharacterized protein n=1 Tax=Physcomitrium patens TaxID=3218 RepID=A0A2K1KK76_PHYPA|nr:hypothetical protein PHYPA_007839 [Physcomitrium patens]